jgi:hypothetical protein
MVGFVVFFSACIAAVLLWIGFIISFLVNGQITANGSYILVLMGLFLPLIMITMAVTFVYTALELKRLQLKINDWIKALKCDVLNDPIAIHEQIGQLVKAQIEDDEPAVMSISKDEPISKYKNMELPEDVALRFK